LAGSCWVQNLAEFKIDTTIKEGLAAEGRAQPGGAKQA
jgi:hypothetical protein